MNNIVSNKIPNILYEADVFIHASEGSLDKAPIESILMGIPVATINSEFHSIFGTWSKKKNPSIMDEIEALYSLPRESRIKFLAKQKQIALNDHSLQPWAKKFKKIVLSLENK